jgi:hypothetical protein
MMREKCKNNAKIMPKIMQNNAGACPSRAESGAAYMLYLKGLAIEIGSEAGFRKKPTFLS